MNVSNSQISFDKALQFEGPIEDDFSLLPKAPSDVQKEIAVSEKKSSVAGTGKALTARQIGEKILSQPHESTVACNREVLKNFRAALSQRYGVFGEHAFDMVLGDRLNKGESLQERDVQNVSDLLDADANKLNPSPSRMKLVESRFRDEVARQVEAHPLIVENGHGDEIRSRILNRFNASKNNERYDLAGMKSHAELSQHVSSLIAKEMQAILAETVGKKDGQPQVDRQEAPARQEADEDNLVMGLRSLKKGVMFSGSETSVEDRMRSGTLSTGMRVNAQGEKFVLEGLKEHGVEPGFLVTNDWTAEQTKEMMKPGTYLDGAAKNVLTKLKLKWKDDEELKQLKQKHFGEIRDALKNLFKDFSSADMRRLDGSSAKKLSMTHEWTDEQTNEMMKPGTFLDDAAKNVLTKLGLKWKDDKELAKLKQQHSAQIRDELTNQFMNRLDGSSAKKLCDRHIIKLDYNEKDQLHGSLRLPARSRGGDPKKGWQKVPLIRLIGRLIHDIGHRTTVDKASCDAVREALANDITRALGIPTQDLEIVRGQYSDGRTKLMLKAKFAKGYKDFGTEFIKDGRLANLDKQGVDENAKKIGIGMYKTAFLLLADRDAIGGHGKNKGMVDGKFFAIDPGHSLEGSGKALEIRDDFSFKDTKASKTRSRFENFTVFDDSNRSQKLRGWRDIVKAHENCVKIFKSYQEEFAPGAADEPDHKLKVKISENLKSMFAEFEENYTKMKAVFHEQVQLHADITEAKSEDVADQVIDAIENLERATSPVRWKSAKNEVELNHLEVIHETRVKWSAKYDKKAKTVVFSTDANLSKELLRGLRSYFDGGFEKNPTKSGVGARIEIPIDRLQAFLDKFTEDEVRKVFHRETLKAGSEPKNS